MLFVCPEKILRVVHPKKLRCDDSENIKAKNRAAQETCPINESSGLVVGESQGEHAVSAS
jgi:hypothetical protein